MICLKWPWVIGEPTRVQRLDFIHTRKLDLGYKQSWLIQLGIRFSLIIFTRRDRIWVERHVSFLTLFTWTPLDSSVVPMTQQRNYVFTLHCLQVNVFTRHYLRRECLREPLMSSMSTYIFRDHLRWVNQINRDFYLCSSRESHKHISPSTTFVINTPKPTRGGTRYTYNNTYMKKQKKKNKQFRKHVVKT